MSDGYPKKSENEVNSDVTKEPVHSTWKWPLITVLGILPALALIAVFTILPAVIFMLLPYLGIFYTAVVLYNLYRSWKAYQTNPITGTNIVVKSFGLYRQKTTLALNIALTLSLTALTFVAKTEIPLYIVAGLIGTYSTAAIIVNSKWIFNNDIRVSEWEAITTQTGEWELIRINLFYSIAVWVTGSFGLLIMHVIKTTAGIE